MPILLLTLSLLATSLFATAQDTLAPRPISPDALSSQTLDKLNRQYSAMGSQISARSSSLLDDMQKRETRLQQAATQKDSSAGRFFTNANQTYASLTGKLQQLSGSGSSSSGSSGSPTRQIPLRQYLPGVDSISSALKYLQQPGINLPIDKLQKIRQLSSTLQSLEGRLQVGTEIQTFASQREQELKTQLSGPGMASQLMGMNKQVYYYQQQIAQYKNVLHDPGQAEQAVLGVVKKIPAFQRYMDKFGYMGTNFPTPDHYNAPQALQGLQTKASVSALLHSHMGTKEQQDAASSSGADPAASPAGPGAAPAGPGAPGTQQSPQAQTLPTTPPLPSPGEFQQQKVDEAKNAIDKLKSGLSSAGLSSGNSSMTMPDFQPNSQKGKSFWKRFQLSFNLQTQGSTSLLPTIANLGTSLGYRLNDRFTLGGGLSYNVGLGSSISAIRLSSQGISLRSFIDAKIKGTWWFTGAFEKSYMQSFSGLQDLKDHPNLWQNSALVGLTKKYRLKRTTCNIQLLYDLLATYHTPATQPLLFRIGYTL